MSARDIVKKDPANFTPTLGDYKDLQPFRFWCQKVLPLVYDDSLSYYELLCKVVDYLNKTMEDVGVLEGDVTRLHEAYKKLQGYVNDYFSTLDVQEEINDKLDAMAKNGSLTELISPLLPKLISDWLTKNISPTTPVIDKTLTISGAGADAKVTGTRLLKDGVGYSYQYSTLNNYRGSSNGSSFDLNGSSFLDSSHYKDVTLGSNVNLIGFGGTLINNIKNPNTETLDVYCIIDLRNQDAVGSLSLWLSDSKMAWANDHVVYGGGIKPEFGTINIYKFTLKKGGSNKDISNAIIRIDNVSKVPENFNFKFALLTDSTLYDLMTTKRNIEDYDVEICFWGDSLTAGAGGNGTTYPTICVNDLGIKSYKNCGVGGETANTISCRQGGNSLILPAGKVNRYDLSQMLDIYGNTCHPLRQGSGGNTVNPILINGVKCNLELYQTSVSDENAYYIITGYTSELKSETPVKFSGCDINAKINVIFVGQNGPDLDTRLNIIDSMISKCNEQYIVMGLSTGTETTRKNEEKIMLNKYGVHFFNTRHLVSKYGCNIAGVNPTASDLKEITEGSIPSILRSDSVHLNANGYTALGKLLAQKIRANGYI
nr:MAG TPA: hypothetical protein [Caudoviricetes sp.]